MFTEMGFKEAIRKKRQRVSEQDAELLAIKLGNQKDSQLQNELQIRVKQLEEQLDEGQRTPGSLDDTSRSRKNWQKHTQTGKLQSVN